MNDQPTPTCERCGTAYSPDDVYTRFLVDFEARTGFAYELRRPRWLLRFCSEECRRLTERERVDGANRVVAERKASQRRQARLDRAHVDGVDGDAGGGRPT